MNRFSAEMSETVGEDILSRLEDARYHLVKAMDFVKGAEDLDLEEVLEELERVRSDVNYELGFIFNDYGELKKGFKGSKLNLKKESRKLGIDLEELENLSNQAMELGREAAREGKKRIPAHDKNLEKLEKEIPKRGGIFGLKMIGILSESWVLGYEEVVDEKASRVFFGRRVFFKGEREGNLRVLDKRGNWDKGVVVSEAGNEFHFNVMRFDTGSEYGIDGGKVSKLCIRREKEGKDLYWYDRGVVTECENEEVEEVLDIILEKYN